MTRIETERFRPIGRMCDQELAQLAVDGDGDAFRLIMQRNNQRLFRIARGVLQSDHEAEDVVQETYVRAAAALATFRGEASLSTWLTRIALNDALGRRRRRRPTVDVAAIDGPTNSEGSRVIMFPSARSDPEGEATRAEIRRILERAIDELPEPFRLVFVMRDVEEMSIEETAGYLDLKPETVKTRLFRARRQLRKMPDDKLATALSDTFACAGKRCARITTNVMTKLGWDEPPSAA